MGAAAAMVQGGEVAKDVAAPLGAPPQGSENATGKFFRARQRSAPSPPPRRSWAKRALPSSREGLEAWGALGPQIIAPSFEVESGRRERSSGKDRPRGKERSRGRGEATGGKRRKWRGWSRRGRRTTARVLLE